MGKAIKIVPQECISGRICGQIDDDPVPVDQPGDQACRDPQACGVAAKGPSDTDGVEDCESPTDAVHRHGCRSAYCDTPTGFPVAQPGDQAHQDSDLVPPRVDMDLDDFVTLLTNRGIPVSPDGIWDVIDGVVHKKATCISWHQQVQVTTILDRHVACRSLHARQYFDKVVDAPVVQSMLEQERISEHTQTVNVPVPQIAVPVPFDKETDEVILPVTADRTSACTVEQFVDMPVPQIQEQIVEVAHTIPQERISERVPERIVEHIRDVPSRQK